MTETGKRPTRKRKTLTRKRVLEAAVELADRDGLESLSMRNLGSELGVEAMSLYNHVANKDDLMTGMIEALMVEIGEATAERIKRDAASGVDREVERAKQALRDEAADLSPAAEAQFAHNLLDQAQKVLPGLRDHITFVADTSADDGQQFPLHRLGPCYGWANSVRQAGPRRLPYETPLSGLYLTGHWTQPGSGVLTVMLSGVNAARYVLGKDMSEAIWPLNF